MHILLIIIAVYFVYKIFIAPGDIDKKPTVDLDKINREEGFVSTIKAMDDKFIQNSRTVVSELKDIYKNSPKETIGSVYTDLCRGLLGGSVMMILAFIWYVFIIVAAFVLFVLSGCGLYIGYEWLHAGGYL